MPTTHAYQTVIRNVSGVRKYFAFLGPNGTTLAANEDVAITGDVWDLWAKDTIQTKALKYALEHGLIQILQTPVTMRYDDTAHNIKNLDVDNGNAVASDPDWGSYSSSTAPLG
jgi:hypothetical protein